MQIALWLILTDCNLFPRNIDFDIMKVYNLPGIEVSSMLQPAITSWESGVGGLTLLKNECLHSDTLV